MGVDCKAIYDSRPWLRFYSEGVPHDIEVPEKSIPEVVDEAFEKWKDHTAIIFYGRKITFTQLKDQVNRFATALYGLGIRKGDVVALLLVNSPQFLIAELAAIKVGACVTPISPVYVSPEIRHQLENSGAQVLVCMDFLHEAFENTGVKMKNVILTEIADYLSATKKFLGKSVLKAAYRKMEIPSTKIYEKEGYCHFRDLLKKYPPSPPKIEINPKEDLALLPYTGGTTGLAKGVMIPHSKLLATDARAYAWEKSILKEGKDTLLAYMPMYHIYGNSFILRGIIHGLRMVIYSTPDLDKILSDIEGYGVNVFVGPPTFFEMVKDYKKTNRVDWKRLKRINSGGDTLSEITFREWERRTGTQLHEAYGLTEGGFASSPQGRPKMGSWGVPYPSGWARVVNPETLECVPVGEVGELLVSSPSDMKGYWNEPEQTKNALIEIDGRTWLRTGDLVRMDEEGYFYQYDRKRDLIKYKGYSVYAREIEEVLKSHPKISNAGVVGVPDISVGENILAYVVLETEARGKLSEVDIMKYCEERLAHYKVPKVIKFRGEIPLTDVGKVSRRELREEVLEGLR